MSIKSILNFILGALFMLLVLSLCMNYYLYNKTQKCVEIPITLERLEK